jgi:hypothetical protein
VFPGEAPLGKRIAWTRGTDLTFEGWRTIVGVVGNTKDGGLDAEPRGAVFLPSDFAITVFPGGGLVTRADRNVAALTAAATRVVRRVAPLAPIERVLTVGQIKDQSVSARSASAWPWGQTAAKWNG